MKKIIEEIKLMLAWEKNHINFHIGNPMQSRFENGFIKVEFNQLYI